MKSWTRPASLILEQNFERKRSDYSWPKKRPFAPRHHTPSTIKVLQTTKISKLGFLSFPRHQKFAALHTH